MIIKNKYGFIKFQRIGKQRHGLFELKRIEVYPKYRNKKHGTKLFQAMEKEIENRNVRKLFLTTHESNYIARSFYCEMGMKLEATLRDHYYDGERELIYAKYY